MKMMNRPVALANIEPVGRFQCPRQIGFRRRYSGTKIVAMGEKGGDG